MGDKDRPTLGISSCILGNRVRYDGELKHFPDLCARLDRYFELLPICPEVEIGLGVPRPPLHLTGSMEHPRMTGRDDPTIDVTDDMYRYCADRTRQLAHISGYVFKSRSPSCGLGGLPLFQAGEIIHNNLRGLFARAMVETYPELPVAEETGLEKAPQQTQFIQQVLDYYEKHQRT